VIEEFFDPGWYDPAIGFFGPVDPVLYDQFATGIESDTEQFTLTIN